MKQYRFEDIQDVVLNGQDCRLFRAFELNQAKDAYVFAGQFSAPTGTPKSELYKYIEEAQP
jgi:hypothetical protein